MSSGFVSGGGENYTPAEKSDGWAAAQKEIEASRQRKIDAQQAHQSGTSLYETLERNKAAKQDAFEEANRLKNQFRALDEDEAEFLESVLESTRAEEERVKKETAEGLVLFRQQQEEADKKARRGSEPTVVEEGSPAREEDAWIAGGRKRKRVKDKEVIKGLKIRRTSTADESSKPSSNKPSSPEVPKSKSPLAPKSTPAVAPKETTAALAKGGLGLVSYGSDSDDA